MNLEQVKKLQADIEMVEKKLSGLRSITITPSVLDGMPHAKSQSSLPEKIALKIVDAERELVDLRAALLSAKEKLGELILERVDSPCAPVMILHFVELLSIRKVASRLHYSPRNVFRYLSKGRAQFNRGSDDVE